MMNKVYIQNKSKWILGQHATAQLTRNWVSTRARQGKERLFTHTHTEKLIIHTKIDYKTDLVNLKAVRIILYK